MDFQPSSEYQPAGDQPQAIKKLVKGVLERDKALTLLGATRKGITFTIANLIAQTGKPSLQSFTNFSKSG